MKNGYEFENIMITNLFHMIQDNQDIGSVAINIRSQWNERH